MNGDTLTGYHATTKDRGQEILKNDRTIYNDEDFNKFNPGITIIVVN